MPNFDPQDLAGRELESYRQVNTPTPEDTAMAVVNPDGSLIGSGGMGSVTANQGTPNTVANSWPVEVTNGTFVANVLPLDSAVTTGNHGLLTLAQMYIQLSGGGITPLQLTASNGIPVDGSAVTQPISAASLPLPTGASTSANQSTGNTSLASILANQTNGTQITQISGTVPVSGTVAATQSGAWSVGITGALPAGSNVIGHVITDSGSTTAVTGNVTVVQPTGTNLHTVVDSSALPTGAATSANQTTGNTSLASILANQTNGTQVVTQSSGANLHVDVDNFPATQPVSGTVTSNQGTAAALAGAWPVEVTDGTNVLGTSTHPVRIDPTGTTTQPVSGTVTANAGTGTFAISAASLPLPSNASQETGGNLATIATNTTRPSSVTSFQASVTTVEAALATNTAKSIALKAPTTNTDNIYIGTTGVTSSTGYLIAPGDAISMDITNSNLVHAIAGSSTQTLTVLVTN